MLLWASINISEWGGFVCLVTDTEPEGTLRPSLSKHTYFDKDLDYL